MRGTWAFVDKEKVLCELCEERNNNKILQYHQAHERIQCELSEASPPDSTSAVSVLVRRELPNSRICLSPEQSAVTSGDGSLTGAVLYWRSLQEYSTPFPVGRVRRMPVCELSQERFVTQP